MSALCVTCSDPTPSPRSRFCTDCSTARALYNTTKANLASGFNRVGPPPSLDLTIDEFCLWRKATPQVCHFCLIHEVDLPKVGMKSQVQKNVKTMGVDRLDSGQGYKLSNIAPCCFVCNQVKGNRFTEEEMRLIAPGLAAVWAARLNEKEQL